MLLGPAVRAAGCRFSVDPFLTADHFRSGISKNSILVDYYDLKGTSVENFKFLGSAVWAGQIWVSDWVSQSVRISIYLLSTFWYSVQITSPVCNNKTKEQSAWQELQLGCSHYTIFTNRADGTIIIIIIVKQQYSIW